MSSLRVVFAVVIALVFTPVWADEAEMITAKVSLAAQKMQVYKGDVLMYEWSVSTARRGYKTPLGNYVPYLLNKNHRSRIYDNAPMPYSVFFLGGYAVHGTKASKALGKPASHGCVRLLTEHARMFYMLVEQYGKQNVKIIIEA